MTKQEQRRMRQDLKKLLSDKPNGILLNRLQVSYSQTFHRNLNLRECGMKLSDIITVFKEFEEVTINKKKYVRLKGVSKGETVGHKEKVIANNNNAAGAAKSEAREARDPQISMKPVPLTVPQYAFEPIPKTEGNPKTDNSKAAKSKSSSVQKQPVADTVTNNIDPNTSSLEAQMQHYISGGGGGMPGMLPQGVFRFGGAAKFPTNGGGGEATGLLGASGVESGGETGAAGFSFDQGGILGDFNFHKMNQDSVASTRMRTGQQGLTGPVAGSGVKKREESSVSQRGILGDYNSHKMKQDLTTSTRMRTNEGGNEGTQGVALQDKALKGKSTDSDTSQDGKIWQDVQTAQISRQDSQDWPSLANSGKNNKPKKSVAKNQTAKDRTAKDHTTQDQTAKIRVDTQSVPKQKKKPAMPLMNMSDLAYAPQTNTRSAVRSGTTYFSKSRNIPDQSQLDAYAQNCIINLAESKELVSIEKVMTLVKQRFQADSLHALGLRREFDLDSIMQLQRLQSRVNASIQAFIKVRAIATLHELYGSLSTIEGKSDFAEHNLGPLLKQPLVYDLFKFPSTKPDSEIPQITTMDVMELLQGFMTKKNLWKTKVKLEEFLEYVVTDYGVETPYELGIWIKSVGLAISVIKTAQRDQKQTMDRAREDVKNTMKDECQSAMMKIQRAVLTHVPDITGMHQFTPNTGAGLELRKSYVTMTAVQAINVVFQNVCELFGRNYKLDMFASHLNSVKQDPLASSLFQLALCLGSLEPPQELKEQMGLDDDEDEDEDDDAEQQEDVGTQRTDAQVLEELKRFLDKLVQMGVPKLKDLATIERRLCTMYSVSNFSNLMASQRTFLEFMAVDHSQVLEAFGGSLLGIGNSNPMEGSPYRPSRMDIMEFIRQCDPNKKSPEAISAALCSHYRIRSVEELGQGQLSTLMKPLMTSNRGYNDADSRLIIYEQAVCADIRSCDQKIQQVGLLGTQSLERALGCLSSAPLLEDLAEWTHWELVFEPEHGDLKSFIEKNPGLQLSPPVEIQALETKPGVMLKLASHSTTEQFSAYAQNGDAVNTAGHLVSLVVHDGIANVPMALLGNHMDAALRRLMGNDFSNGVELEEGSMIRFAMEILTRIPSQIAQAVAQQVILRPLCSVVGSDTKSRQLLLQVCTTSTQTSRLQKLGLLLGISQWKTSIMERLPMTTNDADMYDDIDDDDEDDDVDVAGLLAAAASTSKIQHVQETMVGAKDKEPDSSSVEATNKTDSKADDEVMPVTKKDDILEEDEAEKDDILEAAEIQNVTRGDNVAVASSKDDERSDDDGAESKEDVKEDVVTMKSDVSENNTILDKKEMDEGELEEGQQMGKATLENGKESEGYKEKASIDDGGESDDEKEEMKERSVPAVEEKTNGEETSSSASETSDEDDSETSGSDEDDEVTSGSSDDEDEQESEPEPEPAAPELTESQQLVWNCKGIVDDIRHHEFGIGMQLTEETRKLMQNHQEKIGRSLQRLSEELYTRDTHFVLELIQNADDNKYDIGVDASLVFVVDNESVTAMNNEKGFSEQDIRALCDVGKSTKGKHKHGYIGHKGIGFKSVFRVTNSPEIHSSGYHVCFQHGKDAMGYILPTWIGPQDLNQAAEFHTNTDWTTTIKLPLKGDMQRTSSLVNKFQDIQPSLLLFLHRLKSIVIVNKNDGGASRRMKRQDIGGNVVEIKHNKVTDSWLVVKEMLDATKLHRDKVESTELALAFPLKTGPNSHNREQSVFAFLPLRSYGFHFIIQGDFDIPSSREDVDADSAWNQWLQQSVAPLFVQALESFKDHFAEDVIQAVCNYLQFVPLESQILTDFFKKVAVSIHQRLRATPCLPVVCDDSQDDIEWKLPSETVMAKDPLIRKVVQSSVLKTHLNCYYLHKRVVEECSPTLLSNLGVKCLKTSDLIGILKSVAIMANNTGDHLPVETVGRWLACIYRCREQDYDVSQNQVQLEQLRDIPIIPLTSGQSVAIKDLSVFFPLTTDDKVSKSDQQQFQTGSRVLKAVEADMAMLDSRLLCSLDDVANSQIRRMLEELGVRHISSQEVIQHHILPVLKSDNWKSKTRDTQIGYLVYIKEKCERQPSVCDLQKDLKPCVQVMTNHGPCNPGTVPVHFTTAYGNTIDLPKDLPGCDWILLDSSYLLHRGNRNVTDKDINSWNTFFSQLGVLMFLAVETKVVTYKESEMGSSPWSDLYSFWPKPADDSYTIQDEVCQEFEDLIAYNIPDPQKQQAQRHKLINLLHLRWQDGFAKNTIAELTYSTSGSKQVPSSFAILLRSSPWLPSVYEGQVQYKSPTEIFLHSQKLYDFLGPHVPYLTLNIDPSSQFLQFLNIRNLSCITPDFMLAMLKRWCHHTEDASITMTTSGLGAKFQTSLGHIIRVLRYLHNNCPRKDMIDLFDNYPAIFVPQEHRVDWRSSMEDPVQGQFVHKRCTYWHDPSGLLQKQTGVDDSDEYLPKRFAVCAFYQDLSNIFVNDKLIDKTPNLKEYVDLLVDIVSEITLPDNAKMQDVLKVYGILGQKCAEHSNMEMVDDYHNRVENTIAKIDITSQSCKFLRGLMLQEAVFPTRANRWINLSSKPILCDDDSAELEKLFSHDQRVHLLNMADKDRLGRTISGRGRSGGGKEQVKLFLEACQIQTLTECVEREFIPTLLQASPNVQLFLHTICPYIQMFISMRSQRDDNFSTLYQQLQENGMTAKLKSMAIYEVDRLEVVHRMKHQADILVQSVIQCGIEQGAFYIVKKEVHQLHKSTQVRREIAQMFTRGFSSCQAEVFNFLGNLLLSLDPSHLGKGVSDVLREQLGLDPLDEDGVKWEIVKPIMPEIRKPPPPPEPIKVVEKPAATKNDEDDELEGDSGLIHSWPPKSSVFGPTAVKVKSKEEDKGDTLKMWPPPAPPASSTPLHPPPVVLPPDGLDYRETNHSGLEGTGGRDLQRQTSSGQDIPTNFVRSESTDSGEGRGFHRQVSTASVGSTSSHGPRTGDETYTRQHSDVGPRSENTQGGQGSQDGQSLHRSGDAQEARGPKGPKPLTLGEYVVDPNESVKTAEDFQEETSEGQDEEADTEDEEEEESSSDNDDEAIFATPPSVQRHHGPGHFPPTPITSAKRSHHLTPIQWSASPCGVEVEFEDLVKGAEISQYTNILEISADQDEKEVNKQTGRWGEELVFNYLQQQSQMSGGSVKVTWVNESGETGNPYDVLMERDGSKIYVEVKATKLDQKELFEISSKEVAFAEQKKERFHLYRVYSAGSRDNVRLCRLQNLASRMERKEVRLYMYI